MKTPVSKSQTKIEDLEFAEDAIFGASYIHEDFTIVEGHNGGWHINVPGGDRSASGFETAQEALNYWLSNLPQ